MSWIKETWEETAAPEWRALLDAEFDEPYMKALADFLDAEVAGGKTVLPPREKIFRAFSRSGPSAAKAVILGQDPYHGPGQACGLAFSVGEGGKFPPSLRNIFKEIEADTGAPAKGRPTDLGAWGEQGAMLLNTVLTVRAAEANSHQKKGWEQFTRKAVEALSAREEPLVFLLWGASAQKFKPLIAERHLVLETSHPSGLSANRGFFGCRHFSKANAFLKEHGREPIDW
jgi:uracil-DNA glycosylase